MDKSSLRQSAIATLEQLDMTEKKTIEQRLLHHLIHTPSWQSARTIGITISNGFEWDTYGIIKAAWEQGKTICAPKCYPKERKLDFYRLESFQDLEVVFYNLQEPIPIPENKVEKSGLDMVVVPGLLFDVAGFRIGFGGGYYDRFLTDYYGHTIALTSSKLLTEIIPRESHDIAVQQVITEAEVIDVKG